MVDNNIAMPVRFNPFKHHRSYIMTVLDDTSPEEIIKMLDPLCNNYIDIYTGGMSFDVIASEIVDILKSKKVLQLVDFTSWVASKNGYQQLKLRDGSEWVVRKSNDTERYIHIHPTHTGSLSIRFKGSTLKTVYLLKARLEDSNKIPSLREVNETRMQIGLSPVNKLDRTKGILKCYETFFNWRNCNQTTIISFG